MELTKRILLNSCVLATCLVVLTLGGASWAESLSDMQQTIDSRLTKSLSELGRTRDRIAKKKIPLSREIAKLEDQVLQLRQEQARLLQTRDSRTIDLTTLRKSVSSMGKQEEFIDSRLGEFVRDFEGRLDISELPRYEELTGTAKLAVKNVNLDAEGRRQAQIAVVEAGLERVREQLGGTSYAGEALSPEGVLTQGRFLALGPTVYYASDDGRVAGIVEAQLNAADPVVAGLPEEHAAQIVALASGEAGRLPLDATLGKALKKEKARKSLAQYVTEGGAVGYVIIGLGLSALLITLFKVYEISSFRVAGIDAVDEILRELATGSQAGAMKIAQEIPGVAGEMLETGVEHAAEKRGVIDELLFERILRARPGLERFLPFLSITAAAAPLLGLLGTVIGMIKTFQLITIFGTGDAKSLSSGISEALVTTALGLIVAIPILILHGALSRMAKRQVGLLEQLSVNFVNGVTAIRHKLGH